MDGYFICGPPRNWRTELLKFCPRPRYDRVIGQWCEECKSLPTQSRSIQPPSYGSASVIDGMLTPEEEEPVFAADRLECPRLKRRRRLTRCPSCHGICRQRTDSQPCRRLKDCKSCPWESFLLDPSLQTISVQSAKFPFLMVIKPGKKACFLKNLVLPVQVELKHREITPFCGNYRSIYDQIKRAPHCCFFFRCLYSRKSWMLLYERHPACCRKLSVLLLLNPLINQRIDLPVIGQVMVIQAAFSVSDVNNANASPDCVFAIVNEANCDYSHSGKSDIFLAMWRPGWKTWEFCKAQYPHLSLDNYIGMVFCGKRVRCFTVDGWMYVVDLNGDECSWGLLRHVHDPDERVNKGFHVVVDDGDDSGRLMLTRGGGPRSYYFTISKDSNEILKIVTWLDEAGKTVYHFYRLDRLELEWIRLGDGEWMDRSWFFTGEFVFSTAVIGGAKIFRKSDAPTERDRVKFICHDLLRNSSHSLVGDFIRGSSWVCLGY
ncbi:uncharacterized protein [Coffea arabica]|uniref:Uncharacterized protein isoform X1 n=2 Tax=Coffea arabica TaxID=13443 RepID=A0ABM4UP63_COFAR